MRDYYVPPIPEGFLVNDLKRVSSARVDGRIVIIGQSDNGQLFVLNRTQGIDMISSYGSNPAIRSIYCRMTGTDSKTLTRLRRERSQLERERDVKRDLERLKLMALRLGYRVVKIKEK